MAAQAPPFASLEEAEAARAILVGDIESLQAELGQRNRTNGAGRRLASRDYWSWYAKTRETLDHRLRELRAVKAWISRHRQAGTEALVHLRTLHGLLTATPEGQICDTPALRAAIDSAGAFLARQL